jgi:hypothetical protein
LLDGRIVQQADEMPRPQPRQRASNFSASSTASRTNCLMIGSPHGPSARLPKPPPGLHAGDADAVRFVTSPSAAPCRRR